jgi:hypothetical protein
MKKAFRTIAVFGMFWTLLVTLYMGVMAGETQADLDFRSPTTWHIAVIAGGTMTLFVRFYFLRSWAAVGTLFYALYMAAESLYAAVWVGSVAWGVVFLTVALLTLAGHRSLRPGF